MKTVLITGGSSGMVLHNQNMAKQLYKMTEEIMGKLV